MPRLGEIGSRPISTAPSARVDSAPTTGTPPWLVSSRPPISGRPARRTSSSRRSSKTSRVKSTLWVGPGRGGFLSRRSSRRTRPRSPSGSCGAVGPARRRRFIGMHFFSPVPVMPLVELIRGPDTDDATVEAIRSVAGGPGKQVIVSADRRVHRQPDPDAVPGRSHAGLRRGDRQAEDIDTGAGIGLNHPMGPLELADFIGLDVCLWDHARARGRARWRPSQAAAILVDLVAAGHLGQKTGRGYHTYPRSDRPSAPDDRGLTDEERLLQSTARESRPRTRAERDRA